MSSGIRVGQGAFTIVASNYVPMAHVLGQSFLKHHPEDRFVVVVVDSFDITAVTTGSKIEWWGVDRVSEFVDEFFAMATLYDLTEFATALKPFVARQLLSELDVVLYIDPDIVVFDTLDTLFDASSERGVSLTPHCLEPMQRDSSTPSEHDIMQSGIYNLGYVGVGQAGLPFLDWWCERLARDAIIDPSNQLFTDQRWIDIAVPIFDPYIERSPAYNVAYWNLDQRPMELVGDVVEVCGEPLRFFHFSGFDPEKPWWLSRHHPVAPRSLVSDSPALTRLCEDYAERVIAARADLPIDQPYRWNEPIPGLVLTREMRRLFRSELMASDKGECPAPPDPYTDGSAAFLKWLSSPDETGLPRYAKVIRQSRGDLRAVFGPDLSRGDHRGILGWIDAHGVGDFPWLALLDRSERLSAESGDPSTRSSHSELHVSGLGVDVVGYLRSEHGVGEAGRLATAALTAAGVPVSMIASSRTPARQEAAIDLVGGDTHDVKLLAVNADATPLIAADLGPEFFDNSYVIGQWFWELEEFPDDFAEAFNLVDEIWVATTFVAEAVRRRAPGSVKVEVMPLPLVPPPVDPSVTRSRLNLDDRFMFLFSFDFLSVASRKNPRGLLEAYMTAFGPGDGAQLVLKCTNGERDLKALEELRWLARSRNDIAIIDSYLSRAELGALTASADCYVSLHRSEGLGLTMSEAMALGVPVIATGYSGNLDFMSDDVAVLVPWEYCEVGRGAGPYPPGARWAEPDLIVASESMRRLFSDPKERERLSEAGRRHIAANFSPEVCGARMRLRLETITQERDHA
jgi:glycosyltransferase involved in cell wall biosynthesis